MTFKQECRICFNPHLYSVLDLKTQPLANEYHNNTYQLKVYPLHLMWCPNCTHLQLNHVVDKETLYKHYQYVSGTSITMDKYFDWLAEKITRENGIGSILDIACNDASQLDHFKTRGWSTFGVDPAENIVSKIDQSKHTVYNDFFNLEFAQRLNKTFNVILAQNVVAHVDNVYDFINGCKHLLKDSGKLYIQTSQCNMIQNNEFDTIYHEHHSFFSVKSMKTLIENCSLFLERVEKTFIHGTSYLFTISKSEPNDTTIVQEELTKEEFLGHVETYQRYAKKVNITCQNLIQRVQELKDDGYTVIGYGAAAKGNTLLNYCNIKLDYIIDDADIKWNLYTPGMNIPIYPPSKLQENQGKLVIIPLAWNFFDEIVSKVRNDNVIFLRYFPNLEMLYPQKKVQQNITVIAHFYNEEYLLPFWLHHHKTIFTHGILIDYSSTDKSVEIIKSIVPDWTIINSRNTTFDAIDCDHEVMDIECTVRGWKLTLNITEFLMTTNIQSIVNKYSSFKAISIRSLQMIESSVHESGNLVVSDQPLVKQRTFGIKDYTRKTRTLHQAIHGNYDFGRHNTRLQPQINVPINEMVVLWFGYSPMNEDMLNRKLQIKPKMSRRDIANKKLGVEHLLSRDELIEKCQNLQSRIVDFKMDSEMCHYYY
jgi:2-polyprenyl-3-methyl-5-hydroxy-6-metoxy-1,4-benzoquinol methylase